MKYIYDLYTHFADSILKRAFFLHIDKTLSSVTTPGQSGPGSNGNARVLHIHQILSLIIRLLNAISKTQKWNEVLENNGGSFND